ncbi:MAG TPA: acetyl-CoA carboxylase biotin carboxylase subunit [Bacteroidota bacterium]|nr:acetyl-CoA carboxylase biotin carboxylase subunit [Bacteroidota bacterium]
MKKLRDIKRLLIANRGEIAIRVMRACREMGIQTVAVFSDVDRTALHVMLADEAYPLNGVTAAETYLDQSKILDIARSKKIDAIHPGYGFLSENASFAERVEHAGIMFVGPSSKAIRLMGGKTSARNLAQEIGVPTISGTIEPLSSVSEGIAKAKEIGFPVLLKAAAGGGGKGMRIVSSEEEFGSAFRMAQAEAKSAFGDDRVYLEKFVEHPRHIEIQIIGDHHGNVIHLGERECSIQRRHQKVIEESPSPFVDNELRERLGEAAVRLARKGGYTNAGTIEFLVDEKKQFYFLEMNTRLQVEHPVTETITGLDLVKLQLEVAMGRELPIRQADVRATGHAIECRIYAEDPANNFFPSTGRLQTYRIPQGPHVRVDNGFQTGDVIPIHYDPMLAKVITWGKSRGESIETMKRVLDEFVVSGIRTTIPFCMTILEHPAFVAGMCDTQFVEREFRPSALWQFSDNDRRAACVAAVLLKTELRQSVDLVNHNLPVSNWKKKRNETLRSS